MLISILTGLFISLLFLLGIIIMIQQGKGDMGLGALHNTTQALFGGSGGQTLFQKITWVFGGLFLAGALTLTMLKMRQLDSSRITMSKNAQTLSPVALATESSEETEDATTPKE